MVERARTQTPFHDRVLFIWYKTAQDIFQKSILSIYFL